MVNLSSDAARRNLQQCASAGQRNDAQKWIYHAQAPCEVSMPQDGHPKLAVACWGFRPTLLSGIDFILLHLYWRSISLHVSTNRYCLLQRTGISRRQDARGNRLRSGSQAVSPDQPGLRSSTAVGLGRRRRSLRLVKTPAAMGSSRTLTPILTPACPPLTDCLGCCLVQTTSQAAMPEVQSAAPNADSNKADVSFSNNEDPDCTVIKIR